MPTARAMTPAVAGASPVIMTTSTPRSRSAAMQPAASGRGGSLSASRPAMRRAVPSPMATPSTR